MICRGDVDDAGGVDSDREWLKHNVGCLTFEECRTMADVKLDLGKLLGFRLIGDAGLASIAAKIGDKTGAKGGSGKPEDK